MIILLLLDNVVVGSVDCVDRICLFLLVFFTFLTVSFGISELLSEFDAEFMLLVDVLTLAVAVNSVTSIIN